MHLLLLRDRVAPADDPDAAVQDHKHRVRVQLRERECDGGVVRRVWEDEEENQVDCRCQGCRKEGQYAQ